VARVLAGRHRESGRTDRAVPRRIDFIPYPYPEYGIWILSQMQRWRQLRREVDYEGVVREVFQIDHTREIARAVGFPEHEPSLTGVAPVSAGDALECIRLQPFSEPELEPSPVARYPLPEGVRLRLGAILEWLARMTGGEPVEDLEITSDDELGWLEQTLNETVRNARFTREALDEKSDLEEQQRQAVIEAQAAVIRTLSVPILPVLDSVLVLPLIGQIDSSRAQRVMEVLLEAVSRMKAEMVLLDVTGVPRIDAEVVSRLVEIIRATALLGSRCVLVGIRPELAQQLVALGDELPDLETMQDLRSGIDLALGGAGRRVAAGMGARRSG
jgi:anti-anti-sigma regulatory factor